MCIQLSFVLWLTGLPHSGKTTIAQKLRYHIDNLAILDGDELREWLSPKEDFSKDAVYLHNKKTAHIAKILLKHKVPVCVSLVSAYSESRKLSRMIIGDPFFIEVYLKCSFEILKKRDHDGRYKDAKDEQTLNYAGTYITYEKPSNPELILDTGSQTIEESVSSILSYLEKKTDPSLVSSIDFIKKRTF